MTAFYCAYAVEAKLDGTNWTDITPDVIGEINGSGGILGGGPLDRVGDPGKLEFTLNNSETNSAGLVGYYTPGHSNARAGFDIGLEIRLFVSYLGLDKVKFQGTIPADGIEPTSGRYSRRITKVKVMDWMYQAMIHELISPAFAQNKDIGEVVALILGNMVRQPLNTDYETGFEEFGSVFDTVKSTTRALSEFAKVAISELGFIYITRTDVLPEVLRVEGRYTRTDTTDLTVLPSAAVTDYLVDENGNRLVTEDGDFLVANSYGTVEAIYDNSMFDLNAPYGKLLYNRIKCTAYPRIVGADADTDLFVLASPIEIPANGSVTFTGKYKDPSGLYDKVAGMDMAAPVATTDYLMNTARNGSGTNITADLAVTPVYGASEVTYTLENANGAIGYVTYLRAVGRAIFTGDPVDYIAEDSTSIALVGPTQLTLDQKYQDDPTAIVGIATVILDQLKDARTIPDKVSFYANRSSLLMNSFMSIEPGNRVRISEEVSGTIADYFVNGVEYVISPGGFIRFTWHLRNAGFDTFVLSKWDTAEWDAVDAIWAL
jgi:hypothetical protein